MRAKAHGIAVLGEDYAHNLRYQIEFSIPFTEIEREDYSHFSSIDDARVLAYYKAFRQALDDHIQALERRSNSELTGNEPMLGGK